MLVYALMYNTFDIEITSKMCKLFELLKSYENCFDFKNAKTFFEHENEDHVIDLIFDAVSSYVSLYTFFKIELDVLKDYLLKNLTLNCIREFINRTNGLVLFLFKRNNNFRLCVDYRKLNAFIIKNKYLFPLINKTLNRLVSATYFIKLDFKNIYHRIKIRKSNE